MLNSTFRVALVGCGGISQNHLSALSKMDNVTVVALCDILIEKAEAKKEQFGLNANIYTDYVTMLDREKPDSVHIATPHYLHAQMAIDALDRNINVFLEKPLCINRDEMVKLLEAEKKSSAKACVCFQNRFTPTVLKMQQLINDDGGALAGFGAIFWGRNASYYTSSEWRGRVETEGGSVMINQAIHTIDLLSYFLGRPSSVIATKSNHHLKGVIDTEDSCEGLVKFEGEKSANFYATTSFSGGDKTIVCFKTQNHCIELSGQSLYLDGESISVDSEDTFIGKECYGVGHPYLIAKFYNTIENGLPSPVPFSSAIHSLNILLAAYESCDNEIFI